ncbi:hypothetical protein Tdes44962_MAKER03615 [Teratosphaeria destructans]|uniref:Uncharacterized protein n=1 Tax=Teratosphaeria destructans TaxID=418781 RepID=A0A9W7SP84_9PEZI|nr:hypothetical protein Tdes44962_MAKER03615 [Teratosphaeria destructans]
MLERFTSRSYVEELTLQAFDSSFRQSLLQKLNRRRNVEQADKGYAISPTPQKLDQFGEEIAVECFRVRER